MRQTGAKALWPNEKNSCHSLCCRALQTFVPSAQLSKTGVIKPRSVGCSVNRTSLQNYLLEKTGVSLLGPAGDCTHTTQAVSPSPFSGSPWDVLSSQVRDQLVFPRTTNDCKPSQTGLVDTFLFKSTKWKSRSGASNCRYVQWRHISIRSPV